MKIKNKIFHVDKLYKLIFKIEIYQNSKKGLEDLSDYCQDYLNDAKDNIRKAIKSIEEEDICN